MTTEYGWIPGRTREFSLVLFVQTRSGTKPASCPLGAGAYNPEIKQQKVKIKFSQNRP
jgi:hypothetical protein